MSATDEATAQIILTKAKEKGILKQLIKAKDNDGCTALMYACKNNHYDIAKLLLDNDANIMECSNTNHSVILFCVSVEVCDLIIQKAKDQGKIQEVISTKSSELTPFQHFCSLGEAEIAQHLLPSLLEYNGENRGNLLLDALEHARGAYFDYPEKSKTFDDICNEMKKHFNKTSPAPFKIENGKIYPMVSPINVDQAYKNSF